MSESPFAQRLLALFTSPERAEAIAGDFAEARGDRSVTWFWWQVLTTATALTLLLFPAVYALAHRAGRRSSET